MKNLLLFSVFTLSIIFSGFSEPVNSTKAKEIAQQFFKFKSAGKKSVDVKNMFITSEKGLNTFYTVNFKDGGFVIISADDRISPILAYSVTSSAPEQIDNKEIKLWLKSYSIQILKAIENDSYFPDTKNEWQSIEKGTYKNINSKDVSPLLTKTWDQGGAYNDSCPSNTPVGCVATATAQIMNYWEFPATGVSNHHYTDPDFGLLSADFSSGNYDWANMPDNSGNGAIVKLSYHCGIAVDMNYDASGSGARIYDAAMALANYFKYNQTTIDFLARNHYTDKEWIAIIKSEIDASRPVLYAGFSDASGGHAFVFDGYNSSDQFHVNWGWSGSYNGYFSIGNLSPGTADFNDGNQIVIGIQPSASGNEKFYMVKQYSDFPHVSEYPGYIDGVNEQVAWAIGRDGSGDGADFTDFTRTINGGAQWTSVLNGAGSSSFFNVVHFFNANDGFSQVDPENGEYVLYTTADGGDNWTRVNGSNIPDPLNGEYGIVGLYTAAGNHIWYSTNKGRIYYSSDKGYTWDVSTLYSGTNSTNIEIAFDDNALNGLALVSLSSGNTHVGDEYYSTSDGGASWTNIIPEGTAYYGGISSIPGSYNTFISVGADSSTPLMGASISFDGGLTWNETPKYYKAQQMLGVDFVSLQKGYIGTFCEDFTDGMFEGRFALIYPEYSQLDASNNTNYFCTNSDITFTNESSGNADTYTWDFGTDATPPTGTGTGPFNIQYSATGTKTVTLTASNSVTGETIVSSEDFKITDVIPTDIDTIYGATNHNNQTEIYSVDNQSDVNFIWALSSSNWEGSSTLNSIEVTFNSADIGTISTYAKNGCGEGSSYILDITSTVSIKDIKSKINICPNPASDYIILKEMNHTKCTIYDISGKEIISKNINSDNFQLNVSSLKEGSYIFKISTDSDNFSTILIITK